LGDSAVSLDPDDVESHGYSEWSTANIEKRPVAVITPTSTEEVSTIAQICTKYKVPMIPFGAGSSVEGHITAPFTGLSIDMSAMNKILSFNEADMDIVVQPGVNWVSMNEEIKPSGLFLPIDPSPTAHIGGMVATNCSGTNAMRYGSMKDWVVNLTVVLADGSVIKTRRRPRKTSAGYNLNGLFTGSEGTLGFITEVTLKLAVLPSHFGVATTSFPSVKRAAEAASEMMRRGISLAALELMDETQMRVINQTGGAGGKLWPERTMLFMKFSGTEAAVADSMSKTRSIAEAHDGTDFEMTASKEAMESLWSARKQALWAMLAVRPEGTQIWSTDVAVPLSRMAEIIDYSRHNASQLGLFSSVLGHVGDGNFHQVVMYDPKNAQQTAAVRRCVDDMVDKALAMEGTVSGEHGIGIGKKHCLMKELGEGTINTMKTLKRSLDPHNLLNPGKIFDM
jgi:D-lactate dehydrogenase (cytochrome)